MQTIGRCEHHRFIDHNILEQQPLPKSGMRIGEPVIAQSRTHPQLCTQVLRFFLILRLLDREGHFFGIPPQGRQENVHAEFRFHDAPRHIAQKHDAKHPRQPDGNSFYPFHDNSSYFSLYTKRGRAVRPRFCYRFRYFTMSAVTFRMMSRPARRFSSSMVSAGMIFRTLSFLPATSMMR